MPGYTPNHIAIGTIAFRKIPGEKFVERLHARIILPFGIERVHQIADRNDILRVLETGRFDDGTDGSADAIDEMQRLPADLGHLPDGLRRSFRGCYIDKYVGFHRLQLDDMRVDGRLGDLIRLFGDNHRGRLVAEAALQAIEVILPIIIVLVARL